MKKFVLFKKPKVVKVAPPAAPVTGPNISASLRGESVNGDTVSGDPFDPKRADPPKDDGDAEVPAK